MNQEQLAARYNRAVDNERHAETLLAQALQAFREAVSERLTCQIKLATPIEQVRVLHDEIRGNMATWSGGPYTVANISEAIRRDIASARLPR